MGKVLRSRRAVWALALTIGALVAAVGVVLLVNEQPLLGGLLLGIGAPVLLAWAIRTTNRMPRAPEEDEPTIT
jgi:drug/metabolite transporter (DMT)-like permease